MSKAFGNAISWTIDQVVRWLVLPVTAVIPVLAESGILVAAYGVLWLGLGAALLVNPAAVTDLWNWVGSWWLPFQAVAWLLFLPLLIGMWIWHTDWFVWLRVLLLVGIAAWNVIVFMPRRGTPKPAEAAR